MGACAGFAENRLFAEIQAQTARRTVLDCSGHAVRKFRNDIRNIQVTLHARLKIGNGFGSTWMLQVEERAAVGDRRNQGAQLQRSHRNTFAERAHLANAAQSGRDFLFRISAELFAVNLVAGQFTESELVSIVADLVKTELASNRFEIRIIRMRQCRRKIHAAAASETDFRFFIDDTFAQRCQGSRQLDRGTRLRSTGKCQLLIHHRQDASAGRLNRDHGSVQIAECFDGGLAYDRVFTGRDVAGGRAICEGTGVEAFEIAATSNPCSACTRARSVAFGERTHASLRTLGFTYRRRLTRGQSARIYAGGKAAHFQQRNQSESNYKPARPTPQLHWRYP